MKKFLIVAAIAALSTSATAQQQQERQITIEEVNALLSAIEAQRNAALTREAQLMQQVKLLSDELRRRDEAAKKEPQKK